MLKKLAVGLCLVTGLYGFLPAQVVAERELVDVAGRSVTLPDQVNRLLLGEGRFIPALGILLEDPVAPVAATLGDFERFDAPSYAQYRQHFPQVDDLPRVGVASADSFDLEKAISLQPDLAIFALQGHGPSLANQQLVERLEAAGIPVVFIDFRKAPLENTLPSIELLGEILNRQEKAAAFIDFYQSQFNQLQSSLDEIGTSAPQVFIHSRVGLSEQCCETMAHGMLGNFIEASGGQNLAKPLLPGVSGVISPELLLSQPPQVYIATAIGSEQSANFPDSIALGAGTSPEFAQASFQQALAQQRLEALQPVIEGRAHAIWHHFYNSPFNLVALQVFARWNYPDQLQHLDPQATLAHFYDEFQPVDLQGTYWISLDPTDADPED